jgi:hypothetical protein
MTTYTIYSKEVKGNIWNVMVVQGKYNYVNVSKATNNPYRGAGKDFENFDKAQCAYKCDGLKAFILQVELGLISPESDFNL